MVVTHPFHPLRGQRLEVLLVKKRGAGSVLVCSSGASGQVTLPRSWTDRDEEPSGDYRLSADGLAALAEMTRRIGGD